MITFIDTLGTTSSEFPVAKDSDLQGGRRVENTLADMYNIRQGRRKAGMTVYVLEAGKEYILRNNPAASTTQATDWEEWLGEISKAELDALDWD
jgi:hypothetical protein